MSFSAWISGRGRITRAAWWKYYGLAFLAWAVLTALAEASLLRSPPDAELAVLAAAGALLLLLPAIAGNAKRWHDQDHSGWWQLVVLVPVLGGLWNLFVVGALRGTVGPNRFGPDPQETGGIAPAWGRPGGVPRGVRPSPAEPACRTDS